MKPNYRLTKLEKEFAIRWMETGDQMASFREVYAKTVQQRNLSDTSIKSAAAMLMKKPDVVAFIQDVRAELSGTALYDLKQLIIDLVQVASADVNEIVQIRRECCRYCHGENHLYQWAEWEYYDAINDYNKRLFKWEADGSQGPQPEAPEPQGGFGWHPNRAPHHDCPRCYGNGHVHEWVADTRFISPGARKLLAGTKRDKNGNLEIVLNSQDKARDQLLRVFGAWNPVKQAIPGEIRDAADKVADANAYVVNLINSPDADDDA